MGTRVLVYTDGDQAKADRLARELADELIGMRDALAVSYPGIDESLDRALAVAGGPVVLAEGADNPGGGAASDATFVLERMLERGIGNAAVGPFWDPVAVRIAFEAGIGARLPLRIGGKIGPLSGRPLDLDCTVVALQPELVQTGLSNSPTSMGSCALVRASGIEILLVTLRNQAVGTDLFTQMSCDLAAKKIIVVKSSQHFHASYSKIATEVIYLGSPGSVTLDLSTLPYRRIRRPKWPLDV
jgi:microcystin degradation protein MlrC